MVAVLFNTCGLDCLHVSYYRFHFDVNKVAKWWLHFNMVKFYRLDPG